MTKRPRPCLGALAAVVAVATLAAPAAADPQPGVEIAVDAVPVLGTGATIGTGWGEMLVRLQNNGSKPSRGRIDVSSHAYGQEREFLGTAEFGVGAGATVHVRVPVQVSLHGDVSIEVIGEANEKLGSAHIGSSEPGGVTLVDVSETSRLRGTINEAAVAPLFEAGTSGTAGVTTLTIATPRFDPATGDPLLPDRAACYAAADAVVLRTDLLSRLGSAELGALADYVLAGGTLALVVARPEDLRHASVTAFTGGPVTRAALSPLLVQEVELPAAATGLGGAGKAIGPAKVPKPELNAVLVGYAGGNLRDSLYGASAAYGLGEVHVLAFDPASKAALDDPWAQIRLVDLASHGFDRRSTQVFRPGGESGGNYVRIRQELDPNQSSRWAIGVAAAVLCIYALFAGPVNFALASRKGKPLRALRHLPVYSAVAFALVVGIGVVAKGVSGRARHLTLIEAGGGMPKGTARRWRGFFTSRATELTLRATDESSVVATALLPEATERRDHLVVDRRGARLVEVSALPWQTIVVREDGFASLGDGIALVREGDKGAIVVNRSGHDLRAAVLRLPSGAMVYAAKLKDGESLHSGSATDLSGTPLGATWAADISSTTRTGALDLHHLAAHAIPPILETDAPGLEAAWWALQEAAGEAVDWFPDGVPVLLGQLDGGEGTLTDGGLRLEKDRVLVRVVGFGGEP